MNCNEGLTDFDSVLLGRKPYIKWNTTEKNIKIDNNTIKLKCTL